MTIRFRIFKTPRKGKSKGRSKSRKTIEESRATLYVRLRDGIEIDQTVRTHILVNPTWWAPRIEAISEFSECPTEERTLINAQITEMRAFLASKYVIDKATDAIDEDWLKEKVAEKEGHTDEQHLWFENAFESFLEHHELSPLRQKQYQVLGRVVVRYESYMCHITKSRRPLHIDIRKVNERMLESLWAYIQKEHELFKTDPEAFTRFADIKAPKPRSINTMNDLFKKLRTFFIWCVNSGLINNSPFDKFRISSEVYGTPIYLTQEEVKKVAAVNLRKWPHLDRQRDVFVFQCNVGCRVGDLVRLKKGDVADGTVTYIPHKTIKDRPQTIVVPLNTTAKSIVEKYAATDGDKLLPFISPQKYNDAIKEVLEKAGITRTVAILDPLTRCDKKVRICDVASSHMARRTFAGNLYRQVKDPALVAALTGHVEGSKAFSRYRAIDDNIKRELVTLLE